MGNNWSALNCTSSSRRSSERRQKSLANTGRPIRRSNTDITATNALSGGIERNPGSAGELQADGSISSATPVEGEEVDVLTPQLGDVEESGEFTSASEKFSRSSSLEEKPKIPSGLNQAVIGVIYMYLDKLSATISGYLKCM